MRTQITHEQINNGINRFINKLNFRLNQKGYGTFASSHEILGVVAEEYKEATDAVHSNNKEELSKELLDLAVGSIFGMICLDENTVDW